MTNTSGTIDNNGATSHIFTANGTFTFTFRDVTGNTGSVTATVSNIDTTPPVISLIGSGSITVQKDSVYTDSGATWTDNVDGSGTLVASGTVDTSHTGTYTLTYSKTDTAGNTATTATRAVTVVLDTNT